MNEQKKLEKSFKVLSVCREDLISQGFKKEDVLKLDDQDMQDIADKIGEGNMDGYWVSLDIVVEDNFNLKKE